MNIKEIINKERWKLLPHHLTRVKQHNAALDRIADAVLKRIAELEEQNRNMMALFRDFYELEFSRDECWEIIKKYGGDA